MQRRSIAGGQRSCGASVLLPPLLLPPPPHHHHHCGGARRSRPAAAATREAQTVIERRACDLLVIGDSPDGVLAAYSAAKAGRKVRVGGDEGPLPSAAVSRAALGPPLAPSSRVACDAAALFLRYEESPGRPTLNAPHATMHHANHAPCTTRQVIILPSFGLQAAAPQPPVLQPLKVRAARLPSSPASSRSLSNQQPRKHAQPALQTTSLWQCKQPSTHPLPLLTWYLP
jgi:hypothetical protein